MQRANIARDLGAGVFNKPKFVPQAFDFFPPAMEVVRAPARGRLRKRLLAASKAVGDASRKRSECSMRRLPAFRFLAECSEVFSNALPAVLLSRRGKGSVALADQPRSQRLQRPRIQQTRCTAMKLRDDF